MFGKKQQPNNAVMIQQPYTQSPEIPNYEQFPNSPQMGFNQTQQPQIPRTQPQKQAKIIKIEEAEDGTYISTIVHNYPLKCDWCEVMQ